MTGQSVRDDPARRRFEIVVDGEVAGFIVYRVDGGVLTMVHTEVAPSRQGGGVGTALVAGALDDVRARGLSVRPACSFVAAYIREHPSYRDLVAP